MPKMLNINVMPSDISLMIYFLENEFANSVKLEKIFHMSSSQRVDVISDLYYVGSYIVESND